MPDVNQKVLAMVRELDRDPAVTNDVLLKKAVAIDPSLRKLPGGNSTAPTV